MNIKYEEKNTQTSHEHKVKWHQLKNTQHEATKLMIHNMTPGFEFVTIKNTLNELNCDKIYALI